MHTLADGRRFHTLRLSDLSPSTQIKVAPMICQLLRMGRRNEHIVIRRPVKQQRKERGDGRKKEDWQDRLRQGQQDRDRERRRR